MVKKKEYEDIDEMFCGNLLDEDTYAELKKKRIETHNSAYEKKREDAAARSREESEDAREIGPLPACLHHEIVEECRGSLRRFMEVFGERDPSQPFPYAFCQAQFYTIDAVEDTVLHGGKRVVCLPRSYAKTTICEWACAWAILYGYQDFIFIVGASSDLAENILSNIRKIIFDSHFVAECFPAVCYPVACLDGSMGRAPGQKLDGVKTAIRMKAKEIIFPTVSGAPSSGAILKCAGLTGSLRGLKIGNRRPSMVFLDDPQTKESAESESQTEKRWDLVNGDIRGLAGHKVNIAIVAAVTIIRPDDLSDRLVKRWGGEVFSMLQNFPENMNLWLEYEKLRQIGIHSYVKEEEKVRECTDFYIRNFLEMNSGAEVSWESKYQKPEISAIQHAMNLYFEDKKTFFAEFQNRPMALFEDSSNLTREQILRKIISVSRYTVPIDCERITTGIDIQQDCLYWVTAAWGAGFRGHVLDYGRFPGGYQSIQSKYPSSSEKDAFYLALMDLCPALQSRTFQREDGTTLAISRGLIDANRGLFSPQVRKACYDLSRNGHEEGLSGAEIAERFNIHDFQTMSDETRQELSVFFASFSILAVPAVWEPVFGWGKGANETFIRGQIKAGEERGDGWQRLPLIPANLVRHTRYDTDYWKSNVRTFLQAPVGGSGSLTLFDGDEMKHYNFIQHMLSERFTTLSGVRGTIEKWQMIPGRENHLWDCLTMAAVANASAGGTLASSTPAAVSSVMQYAGDWEAIAR